MHAVVTWNEATKSFTVEKDNDKVTLTLDSKIARLNGEHVSLEAAPFSKYGRSYLPLQFISEELLGLEVEWDVYGGIEE